MKKHTNFDIEIHTPAKTLEAAYPVAELLDGFDEYRIMDGCGYCDCGECIILDVEDVKGETIARIAVCEICGDDDDFTVVQ